ncbi:hypothetical protein PTKIN_Ptkin12aG0052300 [Pterospermum kingtungense]
MDSKPSLAVSFATSADNSQVVTACEDGSLEIWLTIHEDSTCRVSSLLWCHVGSKGLSFARLFSNIDGSIFEWDLFDLKQKIFADPSRSVAGSDLPLADVSKTDTPNVVLAQNILITIGKSLR